MTLFTPKTEAMIADAVDQWEEEKRKLEMLGSEYVMQVPFLRTTLTKLTAVGKAKDHDEYIEGQCKSWDMLLQEGKEYANKRRLEANDKKRDSGAMDTSYMGKGIQDNDTMDLSALGKGKGKGKGKDMIRC